MKEERGGLVNRVQVLERNLERAKHQQVQPISGQLVRRGGRLVAGAPVSTATTGVDTHADGFDSTDDADAVLPPVPGAALSHSLLPRSAADATDGLPGHQFASSSSAPSTTSKTLQQQQQPTRQQRAQAQPALNPALSWQTVNVNGSLAKSETGLGAASVARSMGSSAARSLASGATVRTSEPTLAAARPRHLLGANASALGPGSGPAASRSLYGDEELQEELQLMDPMETVAGTIDPLAQHAAVTATRLQQLQSQTQLHPAAELRFGPQSHAQLQAQARQLRTGTGTSPAPDLQSNVQQNGSLRQAPAGPRPAALPNGVPASAPGSAPQARALPAAATGRAPSLKVRSTSTSTSARRCFVCPHARSVHPIRRKDNTC